jgi:formylglycine-generating enzyme required for sulfatase activity
MAENRSFRIFVSYDTQEKEHAERLHAHLALFKSEGLLLWSRRSVQLGAQVQPTLLGYVEKADTIAVLVSVNHLTAGKEEIDAAVRRSANVGVPVVPVLVVPCNLTVSALKGLKAVPDGKPIALRSEEKREEAWAEIAEALVKRAKDFADVNAQQRGQSASEPVARGAQPAEATSGGEHVFAEARHVAALDLGGPATPRIGSSIARTSVSTPLPRAPVTDGEPEAIPRARSAEGERDTRILAPISGTADMGGLLDAREPTPPSPSPDAQDAAPVPGAPGPVAAPAASAPSAEHTPSQTPGAVVSPAVEISESDRQGAATSPPIVRAVPSEPPPPLSEPVPAPPVFSARRGVSFGVLVLLAGAIGGAAWYLRSDSSGRAQPTPVRPMDTASIPASAMSSTPVATSPPTFATPDSICRAGTVPVQHGDLRFCMDKTEVKVSDYRKCMADRQCKYTKQPNDGEDCNILASDREDHPMNCVTRAEAMEYCEKKGGHLQTVQEWEVAAGNGRKDAYAFPWTREGQTSLSPNDKEAAADAGTADAGTADAGDAGTGDGDNVLVCWSGPPRSSSPLPEPRGARTRTCPAGAHPRGANEDGILDLAGNVGEWATGIGKDSDLTDGGISGPVCGGSYQTKKEELPLLYASCGGHYSIDAHRTQIGFRCVFPIRG